MKTHRVFGKHVQYCLLVIVWRAWEHRDQRTLSTFFFCDLLKLFIVILLFLSSSMVFYWLSQNEDYRVRICYFYQVVSGTRVTRSGSDRIEWHNLIFLAQYLFWWCVSFSSHTISPQFQSPIPMGDRNECFCETMSIQNSLNSSSPHLVILGFPLLSMSPLSGSVFFNIAN